MTRMACICASTAAYFFLPIVNPATIATRPAPIAPAWAAAEPPPGVAVAAANSSRNETGFVCGAEADESTSRDSRTCSLSKASSCVYQTAASTRASWGIKPTSSLWRIPTPYRWASRRMVSTTRAMGVSRKFVRFIETWARPSTRSPNALTWRSPPDECRIALAIFLAISTSLVVR